MVQNMDNRKRAFAEVVTVDAWNEPVAGECSKVDLHADVVFGTARVGGEPEAPVRFRLSVTRAEVVVVIPDSEPVKVDRKSVSRDEPKKKGTVVETLERKSHAATRGEAGISAKPGAVRISGELSAEGGTEVSKTTKVEIASDFELITVTLRKTPEGFYGWTVEAPAGSTLQGRAWDPVQQPRLKLIDLRKDPTRGIPPSARVEVRCRREDLVIGDLEIKDGSIWEAVKEKVGFKNRLAAAEAYIRDRLINEGLDVRNISDVFGELTLGSATTLEP